MTWALRRATPADLPAIMALERATFPSDAWSEAMMRSELAGPGSFYLVAEGVAGGAAGDDVGVVGYAGLRASRGATQADIQTVAVHASARRRGLGRALVGALLDAARDRGAQEVFLEVRADNPGAEALYATFGFERIGTRPRYYQPDDVDAHVMRLELSTPLGVRPAGPVGS